MKKNNIRIVTFSIIISMFLSFNLSYAQDTSLISENKENLFTQSYSINDDINSAIQAIQDDTVQEMIVDLYNFQYLQIVIKDGDETEKASAMSKKEINSTVESLAKMSEQQLNTVIENSIESIIADVNERNDIILLPSAYKVLEKYNFEDEIVIKEDFEQVAMASIKGNSGISTMAANGDYRKTVTGYIKTAIGNSTMAEYSMTVRWWTDNQNRIEPYWNKSTNVSLYGLWYRYVTDNIVSEIMPSQYNRQRANIVSKCKLQTLNFIDGSPYHYLNLDVWFYNDGGIDCRYWKST